MWILGLRMIGLRLNSVDNRQQHGVWSAPPAGLNRWTNNNYTWLVDGARQCWAICDHIRIVGEWITSSWVQNLWKLKSKFHTFLRTRHHSTLTIQLLRGYEDCSYGNTVINFTFVYRCHVCTRGVYEQHDSTLSPLKTNFFYVARSVKGKCECVSKNGNNHSQLWRE